MKLPRLSWCWTFLLFVLALGLLSCGQFTQDDPVEAIGEYWPRDPSTGLRVAEHGPVPPLPEWPDNQTTPERQRLGTALFFDNRLSGSGNTSCAVCHANVDEYQSNLQFDVPDRTFPNSAPSLDRSAPSLLNIVYAPVFRWDGSHGTNLYEQMVLPYAESNMNLTPGIPAEDFHTVDVPLAQVELKRRLTEEIPGYVDWFRDAYGQDIRRLEPEEVWLLAGKALAIYIRRAVSRDAPFDRWNAGDDDAISDAAIRGLSLFRGKAGCVRCHGGPLFSDFAFHNLSLSLPDADGKRPDEGRYKVTGHERDRGAFLTPTLRSVTKTTPYFHNGSQVSIRHVIRHITSGAALADPLHSPALRGIEALTREEENQLVAFLKTLSGKQLPFDLTADPPLTEFPDYDTRPLSGSAF